MRHITTCVWCGYREAVRSGNAYPERCPNDGQQLEHAVFAVDRDELGRIRRDSQESRTRTHSFSIREAA